MISSIRFIVCALVFAVGARSINAAESQWDLLVFGATPAGVCAAAGAAREGAQVVLLEPTRHLGGINTGGLCFSDSNQWTARHCAACLRIPYRLTQGVKPDSMAVPSLPIDSHDCQRIARGEHEVINAGTIYPAYPPGIKRSPTYLVPYLAITPLHSECENLLVPVAIPATHVAYSSIRVEPAWMVIGHSAGIAAALATKFQLPVQREDAALKARLLAQHQAVDLGKYLCEFPSATFLIGDMALPRGKRVTLPNIAIQSGTHTIQRMFLSQKLG